MGVICPTCGTVVVVEPAPSTPTERSPYGLLQEELRDEPWWVLVASCLLNRTRGSAVRDVLGAIHERWPSAASMAAIVDDPLARVELAECLRPLGLHVKRAATLVAMAARYVEIERTRVVLQEDVARMPGVGAYALDGYRIFVDPGELIEPASGDAKLAAYVAWGRALTREPLPWPTHGRWALDDRPAGVPSS